METKIEGYETGRGDYIRFEPEEIEKAVLHADKVPVIQAFVDCDDVDDIYFDRPYYLAPSTPADAATFDLLRAMGCEVISSNSPKHCRASSIARRERWLHERFGAASALSPAVALSPKIERQCLS